MKRSIEIAAALLLISAGRAACAQQPAKQRGAPAPTAYQMNLAWKAPASSQDPVAGYDIFRQASGSTSWAQINSSPITALAYSDTSVATGQTYSYYVVSVDAQGKQSAPSNQIQVAVGPPTTGQPTVTVVP